MHLRHYPVPCEGSKEARDSFDGPSPGLEAGPLPSQGTATVSEIPHSAQPQNSAATSISLVSRLGATARQLLASQSAICAQSVRPVSSRIAIQPDGA